MSYEAPLTPGHSDRLTVLEFNSDGSKLLTAAIDHRIAVYDVNRLTSERKQLDSWTAHDAEIRDAKWFHTSTGAHFVTLANDLQMRIWTEDVYQAPMSGRRFRKLATIKSEQLFPLASVDVKTIGKNTYIAVIDRQGLLSIYEPTRADEFHDWSLVDQFYVHYPIPERAEHTSFRVQFDPNLFPLPYQCSLSDDAEQISIAVTAMGTIKLYRSTTNADAISSLVSAQQSMSFSAKGTNRLKLFEVLRSTNAAAGTDSYNLLLRDLAWCADNHLGRDLIAAASVGGSIYIYAIEAQGKSSTFDTTKNADSLKQPIPLQANGHQSNLTSALHQSSTSTTPATDTSMRANHPFSYTHAAKPLCILPNAHMDAWSVRWDLDGEVLLTSGSDGSVKVWKRHPSQPDQFELFAEQAGEDYDSDSRSDDDALYQQG